MHTLYANPIFIVTIIGTHASLGNNNYLYGYLDLYTRPITFLGITHNSKLIKSLSSKYKGVFVLLNSDIYIPPPYPTNFIHLSSTTDANILEHLGECEHFDIVFVEHHKQLTHHYAESLYHLGEHVIVSIRPDETNLIPYLLMHNFQEAYTDCNDIQLFHSHHSITFLKRVQWLEPSSNSNHVRRITSSYSEKIHVKLYDPNHHSLQWLAGINLITFKILGGTIPSATQLTNEIKRLFTIPHLDWMPNNMILQGNNLELIDFDHPGSTPKTVQSQQMLNLVIEFVVEQQSKQIPMLFEHILEYCRNKLHSLRKIRSRLTKTIIV